MVPDYSNINFSVNSMQGFFKDQGVELSAGDSKKLESIFKECDTQNAKGEKGADGVLTGNEREGFMDKVKSACPQIYQSLVEFFITVDVVEELKTNKEALKNAELKDAGTSAETD